VGHERDRDEGQDEARRRLGRPGDPGAAELPPEQEYPDDGPPTGLPGRVESWRRRSAVGAMLTGLALGLREALEKEKEEPSITLETSGEPPRDLPVEADVEPAAPRKSVVRVRPWLLGEDRDGLPTEGAPRRDEGSPAGNRPATPARRTRRRRR
jgi:hypothetical protein